jgi:thymidine kinase
MAMYSDNGFISIFMGPMFSGKTSQLCRITEQYDIAGRHSCVIKNSKDVRYDVDETGDIIISHSGSVLKESSNIKIVVVNEFDEIDRKILLESDAIFIDEGQFFSGVGKFASLWRSYNKHVYISCLDGDYKKRPFSEIVPLLPESEYIQKLHAICMLCKNNIASFTMKIIDEDDDSQIRVGGKETYAAVCHKCHR